MTEVLAGAPPGARDAGIARRETALPQVAHTSRIDRMYASTSNFFLAALVLM